MFRTSRDAAVRRASSRAPMRGQPLRRGELAADCPRLDSIRRLERRMAAATRPLVGRHEEFRPSVGRYRERCSRHSRERVGLSPSRPRYRSGLGHDPSPPGIGGAAVDADPHCHGGYFPWLHATLAKVLHNQSDSSRAGAHWRESCAAAFRVPPGPFPCAARDLDAGPVP